jgi:hypothetical protein
MKSAMAGTASGCLIWVLGFGLLSMCLCPLAMFVGGFTSTLLADEVAGILGPYVCPANSTAEVITFATTSRDEYGNEHPATGYAMQCVDAAGVVVREPSPDYAFYWLGLLAVGSLVLAAVLAVLLAAPLGALTTYLVNRLRQPRLA